MCSYTAQYGIQKEVTVFYIALYSQNVLSAYSVTYREFLIVFAVLLIIGVL